MVLFEWTPEYELEFSQIDDQHKELVRMINELYASIKDGESGEAVDRTLNRLLQYVEVHFETEEAAMQERHYPGLEDHIQLHDNLRDKVLELKKAQLQGVEIAIFELLNFMTDWLKSHILQTDMQFGQFVRNLDRRGLG